MCIRDRFLHFGCGDAACFPVHNWRILYTQMKAQRIRYTASNFRGDRFSSVLENQMQIYSTNFGVWPVTSHCLLPGKYNISWAISLHRTSPKHDQGSLREDSAVEYSRCYSFLVKLIAIVQRWLASALMWMLTLRSSSEWNLEVQFL